jgi:hypothetical protein
LFWIHLELLLSFLPFATISGMYLFANVINGYRIDPCLAILGIVTAANDKVTHESQHTCFAEFFS